MRESDWIQKYIVPLVSAPGAAGLSDDVALLSADGPTIATMDTLVEGVHFLSSDPLETIAQKLVRVNVSDIYAKGATPHEALLSIAWPRGFSEAMFQDFIRGLKQDLQTFDVALIGGDLVGTEGGLTLTLTLTGACLNAEPVRRSGGKVGDRLWINGEIGWGGLGLAAAKAGYESAAVQRYRVPNISSINAAKMVAQSASASMDVSDGLLIDASRLASASNCGAEIELSQVPLARPSDDLDDILAQCTAGDDYCILLSAPPEVKLTGFSQIGRLTEDSGLQLLHQGAPVKTPSTLGFEHSSQ